MNLFLASLRMVIVYRRAAAQVAFSLSRRSYRMSLTDEDVCV